MKNIEHIIRDTIHKKLVTRLRKDISEWRDIEGEIYRVLCGEIEMPIYNNFYNGTSPHKQTSK